MKRFFVALSLLSLVVVMTGCSEKRCACTTIRGSLLNVSHSLEPLDGHGSCSELNREWTSEIDSITVLKKECVPEVE
jgi:hypothetical protein